jgi:hypothetical protein
MLEAMVARFRRIFLIALASLPPAIAAVPSRAAGTAAPAEAPILPSAGTTAHVEVPISQRRLSDGTIRYSVPVRVGGGRMIDAMLDTGSFGLRVMKDAVSSRRYQPTPEVRRYHFASGVVLEGRLARAEIAVGDAKTDAPVVIQIVQSVTCGALKPDCPAARLDAADYRIGGDGLPREGFTAILGLSMRAPQVSSPALNPLDFIGDRRWIIVLPRPDDKAPGKLIINPDPDDIAGFQTFPVLLHPFSDTDSGGRALRESQMPGCLDAQAPDQDDCKPILMDTGAPNGLKPFFSYRVLYDQKDGLIGFKRRE